jgi:hypothetical protein
MRKKSQKYKITYGTAKNRTHKLPNIMLRELPNKHFDDELEANKRRYFFCWTETRLSSLLIFTIVLSIEWNICLRLAKKRATI